MRAGSSRRAAAFSLVELLVVIAVIAILIALLFPALGGARDSAKLASTSALLKDLTVAVNQFQLDEKRAPGYFRIAELGSAQNEKSGFSAMQNMMLDLAGGITTANTDQKTIVAVGPSPFAQNGVNVDLGAIGAATQTSSGATNKSYFIPKKENFVAQDGADQRNSSKGGNRKLPEVVDAFGSPVLAWVKDADASFDTATYNSMRDNFARRRMGKGDNAAWFYWTSNRTFLSAKGTGKGRKDQSKDSLLGGSNPEDKTEGSLRALLGNPAFPFTENGNIRDIPLAPRSDIIFHAAGKDGYFLGKQDRGGKAAGTSGTAAYTSPDNAMDAFDDQIAGAGN